MNITGDDCIHAEEKAQEISGTTGATYISPYNDEEIVWGQGTMGLEIWKDLKNIDAVFISVGGGGLHFWSRRIFKIDGFYN